MHYENISEWNFMTDGTQINYAEQINKTVLDFVRVWDRFESTLAKELEEAAHTNGKVHDGSHPEANYQLFYRVSSGMSENSNLTMGELSSVLAVPLSTATRIVDYLVERGYMQRLPDSNDRRKVRVSLTEAGQKLYKIIDNHVKFKLQQLLSCLNGGELETLFTLLDKVLSNTKEEAE